MSDQTAPVFLTTREYRRLTEFADAVRRERYIGLCYGPPGVGKTLSARHYAGWDATERYLVRGARPYPDTDLLLSPPAGIADVRTVFWTTPVLGSLRQVNRELVSLCLRVDAAIRKAPGVGLALATA